jgi:hypothetical protein
MNRLVHGCRSQKLVLRHEDPAEFEATIRGWFEHYAPKTKWPSRSSKNSPKRIGF